MRGWLVKEKEILTEEPSQNLSLVLNWLAVFLLIGERLVSLKSLIKKFYKNSTNMIALQLA